MIGVGNSALAAGTRPSSGAVSRRGFIRLASGSVLAGSALALLSACSATGPGAPGGAPAAPAGTSAGGATAYPNYYPVTSGPKPDFQAVGPQYQVGFTNFPKDPPKSWTKAPPGLGSKIISYTNTGAPLPPTPYGENPVWQEVNKQLNATVDFQIISQADYQTKLSTMMAGNDLTDFILISKTAQNLAAFLKARAADLTPYLAGDAIKDYPNLAAIPTYSWTNAGCVREGKLYMVPISRYLPGNMLLKNTAVYDAEIGKDYIPKNAEDFKRILQALTRPQQNRYGMGPIFNRPDMIAFVAAMFGGPKNWRLGPDGKLLKDIETPEYKEAIIYFRDLVTSGVFYPEAAGIPNVTVARDSFIASKFILDTQSYGNAWQDDWTRGPRQNPPVIPGSIVPFPAKAGGKPLHFLGDGFYASTTLKQAPPERVKELLRVMDWLAAPFGSQEDLLLTTGLPDRDYTLGADGNPIVTELSNRDANSVPWKYVVQHPQVAYWPGIPEYAEAAIDFEKAVIPIGLQDPTLGLTSPFWEKQGEPLRMSLQDAVFDLVAGRRPLGEYDQVVKEWQNNGGNQLRDEFQQVIAANK
jgi:putative aldouronate transport system substrate-binding protein